MTNKKMTDEDWNKELAEWEETWDVINDFSQKYEDLVWYARKPHYQDVDTHYAHTPKDIREGCKRAIARVEEQYPNEINALMRDKTNWTHGFNSGCLAAFRFLERAFLPPLEEEDLKHLDLKGDPRTLEELNREAGLEKALEVFPDLDT